MAHQPSPPWLTYKEQMDFLCSGDALWEPSPTNTYTCIKIGDVGFIRRGQFHLLFSAGSPLGTRQRGRDVPTSFKPLDVGDIGSRPPRPPSCLRTNAIIHAGTDLVARVPQPPETGRGFSFELTQDRGAALVTKCDINRQDALVESEFETYTKDHYKSWVTFARGKKLGDDVHPVLVSGIDMTQDFTMVTYSDNYGVRTASVDVQAFASPSTSLPGTWYAKCSPHTNHGPQERVCETNQCVFVRYYTMRSRAWFGLLPKVIRAGAGPHDLGSGDNSGNTFPELTAQFDALDPTSDDIEFAGQWGPTVGDGDSGRPGVVVRNTPYDEVLSNWDIVANYVFQNSDAGSVLMHHRDLVAIRTAENTNDLRAILLKHRPRIVVDGTGVGRVTCQEIQQPTGSAEPLDTPASMNRQPTSTFTRAYQAPYKTPTPSHVKIYQPASASIPLYEIASWDGKSLDIKKTLNAAFEAQDYLDCIRDLQARGIEPQSYINSLDKVIDSLPADSPLQKRCIRALRKTCGIYGIFPSLYIIPFPLTKPGTRPFASGEFADVWRVTDQTNKKLAFAVISFRVYEQDPVETINKKYCKEVIVCKRAKHPNVLSIEGVAPGLFEFCMVSPWMENGNLLQYVAQYPGANRLELLIGVARGLAYLHINEVVHGDLKSANILIDEKGSPRLSDFGLCSITRNIDSVNASTPFRGSTVRYSAPEILDTSGDFKRKKPTNKTDVYSFSMVIVEMATGKMPFPDALDQIVIIMISKGKRPQKPRHFDVNGITSAVWKVAKNCWQEEAKDRPEMDEVLRDLEKITKLGEGLESHVSFKETLRGVFS